MLEALGSITSTMKEKKRKERRGEWRGGEGKGGEGRGEERRFPNLFMELFCIDTTLTT
jgi:hypothetical protein